MLYFSILFILVALFTAVFRVRYIAPVIPPLTLLSILGIKNLAETLNGISKVFNKSGGSIFVSFLFVICLALNTSYILKLFGKVDPLPYISGRVNRDEYISKYIPEYPALQYINENLAPDSKIFFIYLGKRGYYCDRDYVFNQGLLHRIILKASDSKDILSGFHKRGVTHLLVSFPIFDKWIKNNCSIDKQELVKAFFRNYTESAFFKNGIGLHILKTGAL